MRVKRLLQTIITVFILSGIIVAFIMLSKSTWYPKPPIRVGILFSTTGALASTERSLLNGTILAIEEINANGGLLGRQIEVFYGDGHASNDQFAKEAKRLIEEDKVSVLFACFTTSFRKRVKGVVEQENHLLIYPVLYEGLEQSPNVTYIGAVPNQQIIPAVKWAMDHLGKRYFLVGSDYIWPHIVNEIVKAEVRNLGGEVVGEAYIPLNGKNMQPIIQDILATHPQVILHSIVGTSNKPFFDALYQAGITPQKIPVLTFSIGEDQAQIFNLQHISGDYSVWSYFGTARDPERIAFVERFKKRFGQDRVTNDFMVSAYTGVKLWAQAVEEAGTDDVVAVRDMILHQSIHSPSGPVYIDPVNRHAWKIIRIGQYQPDGQIKVVWRSVNPIAPEPFPAFKSKLEWNRLLQQLYDRWGNQWGSYQDKK